MRTENPTDVAGATTAERRALAQVADERGQLAVIAADHDTPLVELLRARGLPDDAGVQREIKRDIVDTVGRAASAVLLDPDVSAAPIVDAGVLARDVGLMVRIEADPYDTAPDGLRRTAMIPGLGAAGARRLGAAAAKVMVWIRPDREDLDGHAARLVRDALEDCRAHDLLCVIEAMTYPLPGESPEAFAGRKGELVRDSAVLLEACGARLLKLEYPGSPAACAAISDAVSAPWAVLSAGVGHEEFCAQLTASLNGGASGFIAGRSLWKEAAALPGPQRRTYLADTVQRRFDDLLALLQIHGDPARGVAPWLRAA